MLITNAKAVPLEHELARRGHRLKRTGRELTGPCPVCGGTDRFSVHTRKQLWNCRHCAKGGDIIDLVRHLDSVSVIEAVKTLTGDTPRPKSTRPPPASKASDDRAYEQRQREKARYLWSQRQPIAGSIAERYLREARGYSGPLPPTIAFLPARNGKPPVMIAAFAYPNEIEPSVLGDPVNVEAVHLTALKLDGSGKADISPNKVMIASPAGNPIAVGAMDDSMYGLAITEGIEDGLSVHQATGLGVWVGGSAPHMAKLAPAIIRAEPAYVRIFADGDEAGRRGAHDLATDLARLVAMLELNIEILLCGAQS
jgi:putative DNA primase/helicase